MNYENILTEEKGNVLYITINRESKLNALNKTTLHELSIAIDQAYRKDNIRALVITGSGQKAFVAGADISEFSHFNAEQGEDLARNGQVTVFDAIANCPKPVIAAVNGFALGGGLELAMACHIRVASTNAKLGLPEVSLGLIPGYGGTQRLTQLIGKGKALELILTADMITAQEALTLGLVNHVVEQDQLIAKTDELLSKILKRPPLAVTSAIKAINASLIDGVNGFEIEINEFGKCFGTHDLKEGVAAFLEKRAPVFKGN